MKFITNPLLFVLSVFLFGCISPEERKARQDNAFDISGNYQTVEDSEVPFQFEITNQNGKHAILVKLTRSSPLTEKEKEFLSKLKTEHGITSDDILNQPTEMTFGETPGFDLDGGDNISTDFGKTSKFSVCSDNVPEYESTKKEEDKKDLKVKVYYCLSGVVKKESKNMVEGELTLKASLGYKFTNEKGEEGIGLEVLGVLNLEYEAEKSASE